MEPGNPAETLRRAAMGAPIERTLLAPLASAVAGEVKGMEPREFLHDTTKLSNGVRDLARSLAADVAVAEFGTLWDAEAMGLPLEWSDGMPRPGGELPVPPSADFAISARAPVVIEAVKRLAGLLGERMIVSASVTGPSRLSRLSGGKVSPSEAAELVLAAVRHLCEAGVKLIWAVEDAEPPEDPDSLADAMAPVWSSVAFYNGTGALHAAGKADGWEPFIVRGGPYIPCFDPDESSKIAERFRLSGAFGLALPPGGPSNVAKELAGNGRCAILTHDGELSGRVAARDLRKEVASLRKCLGRG